MSYLLGAGLALQAFGTLKANKDQAAAEARNAQFLRKQEAFNKKSGERQLLLFDRENQVLVGQQESAFAKAGIDSSASARFMATEALFRSQERVAIRDEFEIDVELARLRAEDSERNARSLRDPLNNFLQIGGMAMSQGGSLL